MDITEKNIIFVVEKEIDSSSNKKSKKIEEKFGISKKKYYICSVKQKQKIMKHFYSAKVSKVDSEGEFISTRSLDYKYYARLKDTTGIVEESVKKFQADHKDEIKTVVESKYYTSKVYVVVMKDGYDYMFYAI